MSSDPRQAIRDLTEGACNLSVLRRVVDMAAEKWFLDSGPQSAPLPNGYASEITAALWTHLQTALSVPQRAAQPERCLHGTGEPSMGAADELRHLRDCEFPAGHSGRHSWEQSGDSTPSLRALQAVQAWFKAMDDPDGPIDPKSGTPVDINGHIRRIELLRREARSLVDAALSAPAVPH